MRRGSGLLSARKVILSELGIVPKLKINGDHNFSLGQRLEWGGVIFGVFYLPKMSLTIPKAQFFIIEFQNKELMSVNNI